MGWVRRLSPLLAALVVAFTIAPVAQSADPPERLPEGSTIAGVPVGGMGPRTAKAELQRVLAPTWEALLTVRVRAKDTPLSTARAGFSVDYDWMVERAFEIAADGKTPRIKLDTDLDAKKLDRAVETMAEPWYRAPRNARAKLGITRAIRIKHRNGQGLDRNVLRKGLIAELEAPTPGRVVKAPVRVLRPKITLSKLGSAYPAYVSVDKRNLKLRLFRRLRLVRTYGIAIGAAGFETPRGTRRVLSKTKNPAWTAPDRPWAGSLRGQTIPPGDPRNPLKYAFIALGDGIGIHGTSEEWSIGTRASHGCIRMRVRDIKRLYPKVPVGAPVLIR